MGVGRRHLHKDQCWSWDGGLKKALTQGSVLIMGWRFEEGTYTRKSAAHGMGVGRRQFTKDHSCSRNWLIEPSRKLLFIKCKIIKLHFFRAFNAKRAAVAAGLPGTTLVETGMCPRGCYVILLSRDQPEVTSFGCHVISLKWHHFAATWSAWSDIILLSRDQPEGISFCCHVISRKWHHFAITWSAWRDVILQSCNQPEVTSFCCHVVSRKWRHLLLVSQTMWSAKQDNPMHFFSQNKF